MRLLYLVFAFVALLCGASCLLADSTAESVYIHYSLPKTVYLTAEPIFVSAWCSNPGADAVRFDPDDLWKFDIIDARGEKLPFRGREIIKNYLPKFEADGTPSERGFRLQPGGTLHLGHDCVNDGYGNGEGGYDLYLPPGNYRLFSRNYQSDTAAFTIIDPTDSVDLLAMRSLTTAIDNRFRMLGTYKDIFDFYSDFYHRFPNVVYAQRALRNLANLLPSCTPGLNDSLHQDYAREFVRRFPDSGYNYEIVGVLKIEYVPAWERRSFAEALRVLRRHLINLEQQALVDDYAQRLEK